MSIQQVSPFNSYGFTNPEVSKSQEIKPVVKEKPVEVKEDLKQDTVEISSQKQTSNKKSLADKIFIGVSIAAALTVLTIMGRNGCFGKSIQKFLSGMKGNKSANDEIYKTLRIKNVLNSDKKTVIETLKKSKLPHLIDETGDFTCVYFDDKFNKRICLAYERGENGALSLVSFINGKGVRTDMAISGKKIDSIQKEINDFIYAKKYNIPGRKGPETNIYTKEGELIYKRSSIRNDGYRFSAIALPESNITVRKNNNGANVSYSKYYRDEMKKVRSTDDEYNNALIDLAMLTGIKHIS
ncbi:MAG: hypothetical protein ACLSWI_06210 [Candidatus Gastranaerophilaceae bacterium]